MCMLYMFNKVEISKYKVGCLMLHSQINPHRRGNKNHKHKDRDEDKYTRKIETANEWGGTGMRYLDG